MKKGILFLLVAAMLLPLLPALAEESAVSLSGTVMEGTTVYDGTWPGANAVGTLLPGTNVIVLQIFGDWTQVFARTERIVGWVVSSAVDVNPSVPIYPGVVISQNVSLRESPSTGAKRLASIPNGSIFDLLDEQDGWYRVDYWDGKTALPLEGWVLVDFVVRDPSFITTTESTFVYAVPDRSAKKVAQLTSGTQLVIIAEWGDFWVVNLRSASGFIYKKDVEANITGGNG